MKLIAIITILILTSFEANANGIRGLQLKGVWNLSEYCIDGVAYLGRTDTLTVKYNAKTGLIQHCNY